MFVTYTSEDGSHSECYVVNDPVSMENELSKFNKICLGIVKDCERYLPEGFSDSDITHVVDFLSNILADKKILEFLMKLNTDMLLFERFKSNVLYQLKMHGIKYCEECADGYGSYTRSILTILTDSEIEYCEEKYKDKLETKYECGDCGEYYV